MVWGGLGCFGVVWGVSTDRRTGKSRLNNEIYLTYHNTNFGPIPWIYPRDLSIRPSVCFSIRLSDYLPAYPPAGPSVCLSTLPPTRMSVCLSVCLPVCLSVCLSGCLSVGRSVCLPVRPYVSTSICLSDIL